MSVDEEEISDDEYESESDDKLADLIYNGENIPHGLGDQLRYKSSPSLALLTPLTMTPSSSFTPPMSQPLYHYLLSQNLYSKDKFLFSPQLEYLATLG